MALRPSAGSGGVLFAAKVSEYFLSRLQRRARDDRPHSQTRTTTGFGIMNNRQSALRESASKPTVIVPG